MTVAYDYIIVGAGSAGCVLANRLSASNSVLLVESGGSNYNALRIRAPGLYTLLWRSKYDWNFRTEPQSQVNRRRMYWPRGKVLGGSSCLNAMVYMRGHRSNYDEWRDSGCPGWGWTDVLPYFKKSEDYRGPSSPYHGTSGPLTVEPPVALAPASEAFIESAAAHYGVAINSDFNGADQEGFGPFDATVRNGERCSAANAFLEPVLGRGSLHVVTDATVTSLRLRGMSATGIEYMVSGAPHEAFAEREVVLSAGSIGSPQLLMLSGVGPADHLRDMGIDVVCDLPGVGENLQDHLFTLVGYETQNRGSTALTIPRLAGWVARYALRRSGPVSTTPVECGGFVRTHPNQTRPELQFHFMPFGVDAPNTDRRRKPTTGRHFSILPSLIYPKSRGRLRLRTSDPLAPPVIAPHYFTDSCDLDTLVAGVRAAREIANTRPLRRFRGAETCPGEQSQSSAQLRRNIRGRLNTIFHPVGTCKMGDDRASVVDHELRVRGISGLRVVDGSVMPSIVGGNTNAPIIMIAEKAADLILENSAPR